MLKYLFAFLFFSNSLLLHAQNKLVFYTLKNKADSLIFEEKLKEAYPLYKKAIQICPNNPYYNLSLTNLCIRLKKSEDAKRYFKLAVSSGATLGMVKADSIVNDFYIKEKKWLPDYTMLRQKYLEKIPYLEDRMKLISMLEEGQTLRSMLGVMPFKKVDSLIFSADTTSMKVIKEMISRIGFPDMEKVGVDGSNALFILLIHTLNNNVDDEKNLQWITPLLKEAVQQVKFMPFNMAILIDRHKAIKKQKQIYGAYWEPKGKERIVTPIENIEEVDKRRKEIGLPPLSDLKKMWKYILPIEYDK